VSPLTKRLLICAAVLEAACLLPHLATDRATQILYILVGYGVGGGVFAFVLYQLRSVTTGSNASWLVVLVPALLFRLTLIPLQPATSPDVHRYLWEGVVQRAGFSPYVHAPADAQLDGVAEQWPTLAANARQPNIHPEISAIYPPTAQLLFFINACVFNGALWGWKLILLGFDTLLIWGAWQVIRTFGGSPYHLAAIAWCPLLLFEFYEAAHLDLVGVALLVAAFAMTQRQQPLRAGALLAMAFHVKQLWPLLAAVILVRMLARPADRWRFLAAFGGMSGLLWLPYLTSIPAVAQTMVMFVEDWRFNDLAFEFVRNLVDEPRWAPMAIVLAFLVVLSTLLLLRWRNACWNDMWLLNGWALLLGPVAYPWYFLWIVPVLLRRPAAWAVAWVLLAPALHFVAWREAVSGTWDEHQWLWWIVTIPAALLLIYATWKRLTLPKPEPAA
jgi:hypothetical protein